MATRTPQRVIRIDNTTWAALGAAAAAIGSSRSTLIRGLVLAYLHGAGRAPHPPLAEPPAEDPNRES